MRWLDTHRRRRAQAKRIFADAAWELERRAHEAWPHGFSGGAEWMRAALGAIRAGNVPRGEADFERLGALKYGVCAMAALAGVAAVRLVGTDWVPATLAGVLAFYVVEAQLVFLFPAALDGGEPSWRRAWQLRCRTDGTCSAVATVLPIAVRMMIGGVRGWCCGCIEVLLWYEEARRTNPESSVVPGLVIGPGGRISVRIESVTVSGSDLGEIVRIAWVSDLHLCRRATIRTVRSVVMAVRAAKPDVIVLGGDLVDGFVGLQQLERLVRALKRIAPVWALPGNHDEIFGVGRVAAAVRAAGGGWLPGVVGRVREGAVSLVAGEHDDGLNADGVIVSCLHAPASVSDWAGRCRLAMAGHLHGGQFVLTRRFGRYWPLAFFFRWGGPRFELAPGTTLLVGSGAGDLLPIRWRCPREIVCADLVPLAKAEGSSWPR